MSCVRPVVPRGRAVGRAATPRATLGGAERRWHTARRRSGGASVPTARSPTLRARQPVGRSRRRQACDRTPAGSVAGQPMRRARHVGAGYVGARSRRRWRVSAGHVGAARQRRRISGGRVSRAPPRSRGAWTTDRGGCSVRSSPAHRNRPFRVCGCLRQADSSVLGPHKRFFTFSMLVPSRRRRYLAGAEPRHIPGSLSLPRNEGRRLGRRPSFHVRGAPPPASYAACGTIQPWRSPGSGIRASGSRVAKAWSSRTPIRSVAGPTGRGLTADICTYSHADGASVATTRHRPRRHPQHDRPGRHPADQPGARVHHRCARRIRGARGARHRRAHVPR